MKRVYVKPEIEQVAQLIENPLCAGTKQKIIVKPYSYFGEKESENQYSQNSWINEQKTSSEIQGWDPVVPVAGDDDWGLTSRGNNSLWED